MGERTGHALYREQTSPWQRVIQQPVKKARISMNFRMCSNHQEYKVSSNEHRADPQN
jgi:hypothetical protein